jgi:glycosyltransferase involved in cell wall biosynthesis
MKRYTGNWRGRVPEAQAETPLRSILFLVRGDDTVPSCRFRAYQYREPLRSLGVHAEYVVLEKSKNPLRQILFHLRLIPQLRRHDVVIFQKLLEPRRLRFLRLFNDHVFFDFDDAMYVGKDGHHFPATIRAAHHVIAGNEVLAERAKAFNPDICIVPTPVPIPDPPQKNLQANRPEPRDRFVLSWVGTAANLPYLTPVVNALEKLQTTEPGFELRILTEKPEAAPRAPWISTQAWSRTAEEEEFQRCDVGLMPLPNTEWAEGKCACKALQYLSYGKPVITSPVGMNRDLFADGAFGVLAESPEEWLAAIKKMRARHHALRDMGQQGYDFVREKFGLDGCAKKLLSFLEIRLCSLVHSKKRNAP